VRLGKMLGDLGGAFSVPTVRIGLRLGLFDALHEGGAGTSSELAKRAGGLTERYVREWALAQAANGFVDYDTTSQKFSLSPEQCPVALPQHNSQTPYLREPSPFGEYHRHHRRCGAFHF
jgi:hypothetical protein